MADINWHSRYEEMVGVLTSVESQSESKIFETITGREMDEKGLYHIGKRIFNLQRSILIREGRGGREYDRLAEFCFTTPLKGDFGNPECLVPGKDGETFSRKGMIVDRHEFEKMRDEFYEIREWDVTTGLQTGKQLEALDLSDVAGLMDKEGLLSV
jgi:aldehyde:ferredoxin oxidoreductase